MSLSEGLDSAITIHYSHFEFRRHRQQRPIVKGANDKQIPSSPLFSVAVSVPVPGGHTARA
jgi:hypothetical protein